MKKLLTKPIWWWERQRNYPVRSWFDRLPPIAVRPAVGRFVVLTTPKTLGDALWTAWSWYRFLPRERFELQLAIDGDVSKHEADGIQRLFPGIQTCNVESIISRIRACLPEFETFSKHHPLGRKLGLILGISGDSPVLYCDHDVLAFNRPVELLEFVDRNAPCFMSEEHEGNWDPAIVEHCKAHGVEYLSRFNSGLLHIPKGVLSLKLAGRLLSTWKPPANSWYTEQTILSVLMRKADALPLPRNRYVVSNRRQFYWEKDVDYDEIAVRHFTGTVRHVMYKIGIPTVLRQSRLFKKELRNA